MTGLDWNTCALDPGESRCPLTPDQPTGKTILVVEDNQVEREGLAAILLSEGYAVATAVDGAQALDVLRAAAAPCLVLLDMMLPNADGWHFLAERDRDPGLAAVPVLITTGLSVASPEWAKGLGAAGCFRKPLPVEALLDEVRRLCAA
jgi:putative two-component system response regulator